MCTHAYTESVTKTVSLSDEAYERLDALKGPDESFSDVALRLVQAVEQDRILEYAGEWDLGDEQREAMKSRIRDARDRSESEPVNLP